MEMYSPLRGKLRRTHYEGVNVKFAMSDLDYSLQAKIGHVQVRSEVNIGGVRGHDGGAAGIQFECKQI